MIKKIRGIKIELIIISIALFVLGLFLTIFPEVSQIIICRAVGIALCVWGVLRLMTYFRMSREDVFVSFGLVQGISLLAFGIFFVMRPEAIAVFFGTAIAIIIIIDGILKLQYAIEFYHMEAQRWWIEAIVAALMVVMGVVALFNPFGSSTVLMMFVGIVLMVEGLSDLISIIRISSFIKNLRGWCIVGRRNRICLWHN